MTQDLPDHLRTDSEKIVVPPYYPDTPKVKSLLARHYDNIATMDIVVKKLLKELKDAGESENTIVFFIPTMVQACPDTKGGCLIRE